MQPLYYDDDGTAVFSTNQLDTYGLPEENGFEEGYLVLGSAPSLTVGFVPTNQFPTEKSVHRYDRFERFTTCLKQLLGIRGVIGKSSYDIQDIMHDEIFNFERSYMPQCLVWARLRRVLSKHGKSTFFNRIPQIAQADGFSIQMPIISRRLYQLLCDDFTQMHKIFPRIKRKIGRNYFPSIRAVCLLLMERYEIPNVLMIPIAHTKAKNIQLRETFDNIWYEINCEMSDLIFD